MDMMPIINVILNDEFICSTIIACTSMLIFKKWDISKFPFEFHTISTMIAGSISYYLHYFDGHACWMHICRCVYAFLMLSLSGSINQHMDVHIEHPKLKKAWKPIVWFGHNILAWTFFSLELSNEMYKLYIVTDLIVVCAMCLTIFMVYLHHTVWCKIYHIDNAHRKEAIVPFLYGSIAGVFGYAFRYLTYFNCAGSMCTVSSVVWYAMSLYMFVCFTAFSCAGHADVHYKDLKLNMHYKIIPQIKCE